MNLSQLLLSSTFLDEISMEDLEELSISSGSQQWEDRIKYEVKVYKISYLTDYIDKKVNASGIVYVPQNTDLSFPILSLQHGTLFLKSEAPSENIGSAGGELISSAGYIVIQSDYIGYGDSERYFHPYYDKAHAASSAIDMLAASLSFLQTSEINYLDELYLLGYSEGGYVTMAMLTSLEKKNSLNLELKAAAVGAGGYDLFGLLSDFTTGTGSHVEPSYIVFLLMAYEKTYEWNKPLHHYFSKEYAELLPELMNGNYNCAYINSKLTNNLALLFNPEFYKNLTGTGEMELKKALFINTLSDCKPSTPLRLYHGTEDEVIPFKNSETTFEKYKANGAASVIFMSIPGGNHATSKPPMIDSALDWFTNI